MTKAKGRVEQIPHSMPWITGADVDAVRDNLLTGMIAKGKLVSDFEKRFAQYNECAGAISFPSGTSALGFALEALGASDGKEVILPTYVCTSVLQAVRSSGAKPVLCDIGEETWNMTYESVSPHVTKHTAAIVAVHIFGIPADVRRLREFGVPVIEDCAQALGSDCSGSPAGSTGDIGFYSFHATKCLTTGEGGMLVTSDRALFDALGKKREGLQKAVQALSDLQAALGISQLARYDAFIERRKDLAAFYFNELPPEWTEKLSRVKGGNIFFRFPLEGNFDFDKVRADAGEYGVSVRRGVDLLLHRTAGLDNSVFPNAERAFERTLSIPIYPSLTQAEQARAVDTLKRVIT